MAVVPIGTYFATLKYFTKGEHLVLPYVDPKLVMESARTIEVLVLS
jgi:hypothetical protein